MKILETKKELPPIVLKERHNYVAFFLTLACNLSCPYCINLHNNKSGSRYAQAKRETMGVDDWIKAANRLVLRPDLPLTFQGGEPTLHPGFYRFVNEVKHEIKMDLLTNMKFDVDEFIKNVPVWRFTRQAPYAAIRVSYHPGQNDIKDLIAKARKMEAAGFRVGLYSVLHPDPQKTKHILQVQKECIESGIDFRAKEYLGEFNAKVYGTFKYPDCVSSSVLRSCSCRTSELIIDPAGYVFRCHSDLYNGRNPVAHILDDNFNQEGIDKFRQCDYYGDCNPCDVKVKTNRFQIFGHTSVEIKDIKDK